MIKNEFVFHEEKRNKFRDARGKNRHHRQRKFGKIKRQSHITADMRNLQPISENFSNGCICSDTAVAVCCRYSKIQPLCNACICPNTAVM